MKFFIYLCCIACLLSTTSARLRRTTPIPKPLRSNDDESRQALKIAEMIQFVNSVYIDDGRSIARSGTHTRFPSKHPMSRRIETVLKERNGAASVSAPLDEDMETQLKKLAETVRYHIIENPEVLEEFSKKQRHKNIEGHPISVFSDAKSFSTAEDKLTEPENIPHKENQLHPKPPIGVQELTSEELVYRPSFPDNDDDETPVTEDMELTITENQMSKHRVDAKDFTDPPKVNSTDEFEKGTQDKKVSGKKDTAQLNEEKKHKNDSKETGQMKHDVQPSYYNLKIETLVTVNEKQSKSIKEYESTKLDNDMDEKLSADSEHLKDKTSKNDSIKDKVVDNTDKSSEKDKNPKERSRSENKKESLISKKDKQLNNSRETMKQHLIYSQKKQQSKKRHRKETQEKYDKKKKDKYDSGHKKESDRIQIDEQADVIENVSDNDNRWTDKNKDGSKIDDQRYYKEEKFDRMEYEWNQRHQQYDKNDNWGINYNNWFKKDYDWSEKDNNFHKRYWNKRQKEWQNRDSGGYEGGNKKVDKDNEWDKRHNKMIEDDLNKKYFDSNRNEFEHKNTGMSIENDRALRHERNRIFDKMM